MSRLPSSGRMPFGLPGSRPTGREQQQPQSYGSNPLGFGDRNTGRGPSDNYGPGTPTNALSPRAYEKAQPSPAGPAIPLQVAKVEDRTLQSRLIYENVCAVSPNDFRQNPDGSDLYIMIRTEGGGEYVVSARPVPGFPQGCISLSEPQRTWCRIGLRDSFTGQIYAPFEQGPQAYLAETDVEIGFASVSRKTDKQYDEDELAALFVRGFQNQVLAPGQRLIMDVASIPILIVVRTITLMDLGMQGTPSRFQDPRHRGILTGQTKLNFFKDAKAEVQLKPSMNRPAANAIIAPDFKFEDMGIGGLEGEFSTIFRRAFASRIFPPGLVQKLGIQHVKGILLYGPPGTGKTLMARQIGKMLNAREPKIINGPEILNKYVGQSEENVRKMFADAEKEYKEKGDESGLHIIIFDELDAVCKQRGSTSGGTGVGDSVVNQLLTKLDGVDQLNNILLIGMTNRKDMIDEALLRPGRLEVQLEISLPNESGRLEILNIHTSAMTKNNVLGNDVNLKEIASLTKNYSGAEISGLVKAATSFAFSRHTKVDQMAGIKDDLANMKVQRQDFIDALVEVKPAYGVSEEDLEASVPMGIIEFNRSSIARILDDGETFSATVEKSKDLRLLSVLFMGQPGTGKTALAAQIAQNSNYPFVKLIGPKDLIPYRDDFARKDYLHKVFTDAYKSPLSLLILDDFENLIEWSPVGQRYSNTILQTIITLMRSPPPKDRRLLVFVTTSKVQVLRLLEVDTYFGRQVRVRPVQTLEELGVVLQSARIWDDRQIQEICFAIEAGCIRDPNERVFEVRVGIKTVLEFVAEARVAYDRDRDGKELFQSKMIETINAIKA